MSGNTPKGLFVPRKGGGRQSAVTKRPYSQSHIAWGSRLLSTTRDCNAPGDLVCDLNHTSAKEPCFSVQPNEKNELLLRGHLSSRTATVRGPSIRRDISIQLLGPPPGKKGSPPKDKKARGDVSARPFYQDVSDRSWRGRSPLGVCLS